MLTPLLCTRLGTAFYGRLFLARQVALLWRSYVNVAVSVSVLVPARILCLKSLTLGLKEKIIVFNIILIKFVCVLSIYSYQLIPKMKLSLNSITILVLCFINLYWVLPAYPNNFTLINACWYQFLDSSYLISNINFLYNINI